jgi:glycosyltransferase involved in cell wall biosynthesis
MPVYNAAAYVVGAARSILSGTFRDLQLLAINDGSTDESEATLRSIVDPRLKVVGRRVNIGVARTLNEGLDLADGEFVARMDADDISMPQRLAQQIAFMEANTEIGACGTWATTFGRPPRSTLRAPLTPAEIHARLFGYNALVHPTVILRRSMFVRHALRFSAEALHAEDLDLWMRAAECFPLSNISIVGLRYRVHANQVTTRHAAGELQTLERLRKRQLALLLPQASEAEIALHLSILDLTRPLTHGELAKAGRWLAHLEDVNERSRHYDSRAFRAFLAERWLNAAHRCLPRTVEVWHTWRREPLASAGIGAQLRLFLKALA